MRGNCKVCIAAVILFCQVLAPSTSEPENSYSADVLGCIIASDPPIKTFTARDVLSCASKCASVECAFFNWVESSSRCELFMGTEGIDVDATYRNYTCKAYQMRNANTNYGLWKICCMTYLNLTSGRTIDGACQIGLQPNEMTCNNTFIWITCPSNLPNCTNELSYNHPYLEVKRSLLQMSINMAKPNTYLVLQSKVAAIQNDFIKPWSVYKRGFGSYMNNFWIGNDNLNSLTSSNLSQLRVEFKHDVDKQWHYAEYAKFYVSPEVTNYTITVANFTGDFGDAFLQPKWPTWSLNGMQFTTYDRDNDKFPTLCSTTGWWYNSCSANNLCGNFVLGWQHNKTDMNMLIYSSKMLMMFA